MIGDILEINKNYWIRGIPRTKEWEIDIKIKVWMHAFYSKLVKITFPPIDIVSILIV